MTSGLSDTDATSARVQIDLLRAAGVGRRSQLMRSLSRDELSPGALAERMPGAAKEEVVLRWVRLQYGEELADRPTALSAT